MALRKQHPFWTHDTVAAAVLAAVGAASLQIKLDAVADELNIPALTACIHAWPMVLIAFGLVLLLVQSGVHAEDRVRRDAADETVIRQTIMKLTNEVGANPKRFPPTSDAGIAAITREASAADGRVTLARKAGSSLRSE